ncbi:LysE/ArgO family amino acid transporter [Myceligenerans crystallogenes]|uniref:L-lysine exporter n=1 Tax=Myceligenerans crystallogenes TaxID=316335 RepID=A0ABP4ZVC7_9MICO
MTAALLAGLGFSLSLIVAIGPQNAYVLRQGARREHVVTVVVLCAASDTLLIAAGIGGFGSMIQSAGWLLDLLRWAGAAVVAAYGVHAAVRAIRGNQSLTMSDAAAAPATPRPDDGTEPARVLARPASPTRPPGHGQTTLVERRAGRRAAVAVATLALTWLNPHVYLDTLVLMGSVGAQHGDLRWWFALGAIAGSWLWFTALGWGAWRLAPVLARPAAWRVIDAAIAAVMLTVAVSLVLG